MLISCPNCTTRYNIDPAIISNNGRKVRCVQCRNIWIQTRPDSQIESETGLFDAEDGETIDEGSSSGDSDDNFPDSPSMSKTDSSGSSAQKLPGKENVPNKENTKKETELSTEPSQQDLDAIEYEDQDESDVPMSAIIWVVVLSVLLLFIALAIFLQDNIIKWIPVTREVYTAIGMEETVSGDLLEIRLKKIEPDPARPGHVMIFGEVYNISAEDLEVPRLRASILDKEGAVIKNWDFSADSVIVLRGDKTSFRNSFATDPRGTQITVTFVEK